jgi:hypothetical protein
MDALEASHATVMPDNKEHLEWYYNDKEEGLPAIRLIVESIYTNILEYHSERFTDGNEKLHTLRGERMAAEIQSMKALLSKPKYQLDDVASVSAVCGTRQMELVCREDTDFGTIPWLTFFDLVVHVLDIFATATPQEDSGSRSNICSI